MAGDYEIRISEIFESVGLDEIPRAAAAALRELAQQAGQLSNEVLASQYQALRGGAEGAVTSSGGDPRTQASIRGQLTNLFGDLERLSTRLRASLGGDPGVQQVAAMRQRLLGPDGSFLPTQQGIRQGVANANRGVVPQADTQESAARAANTQAMRSETAARMLNAEVDRAEALAELAERGEWSRARARVRLGEEQLGAQVEEELASNSAYGEARGRILRSMQQNEAVAQEELATTSEYAQAQARAARAKALISADTQEELAATSEYSQYQARATRAKAFIAAETERELASDRVYADIQAQAARAKAQITAMTQEELASDGRYATSQAEAARAKQQIAAMTQESLGADTRYAEATARAATARDRVAGLTAVAQNTPDRNTEYVQRKIAEEQLAASRAVQLNQTYLNEPGQAGIRLQAAQRSNAETVERQRNILLEEARMEESVLAETAKLAQLKRERNTLERAAQVGVLSIPGESTEQMRGRVLVAEGNRTLEERLQAERSKLAEVQAGSSLLVEERVLQARLNQEIEDRVRAERRSATPGGTGIMEGGGTFQRLQALVQSRQSGDAVDPTKLMNFGQFATSRIITTAGFAASGALLYGGVQTIREMIKAGEDLQLQFAAVKAEFNSLGQGDEFKQFRGDILEIARDTGTLGTEAAQVGLQMKGAFQDTTEAVKETRDTLEAMKVTGLTGAEAVNTFVALSKTFGESIDSISDKALGLQDRFGIMAKEIITGAASIAPVAKSVGLSFDDLASMIAAAAQASGRPATAIAESLGRILPEVPKNAGPIMELYKNTPTLQPEADKVTEMFKSGNEGQVILQLTHDWKQLSEAQQGSVLQLLGGRREAQNLAAVFQNSDKILAETSGKYDDAGRTAKGFAEVQATLAQALAQAHEELRQLGDQLARMGLLDAFKTIVDGGGMALLVITKLLGIFEDLDGKLGGAITKLAGVALAIVSIQKAIALLGTLRAGSAILGAVLGGGAAGGGALTAGAVAAPAAGGALLGPNGLPIAAIAATQAARVGFLARMGAVGGTSIGPAGLTTGLGAGGEIAGSAALGGVATLGLGAAAVGVVQKDVNYYDEKKAAWQKQIDAAQKELKDKDLLTLEAIKQAGVYAASNREKVGGFILGTGTEQDALDQRIGEETVRTFQTAVDKGLLTGVDNDEVKNLLSYIKKHGANNDAGRRIRQILDKMPKKQKFELQQDVQSKFGLQDKINDIINTGGQEQIQTAQDAVEAFSSGQINYGDMMQHLNSTLDDLRSADNGSNPDLHKLVLQAAKLVQQQIGQHLSELVSFAQLNAQIMGEDPSQTFLSTYASLGLVTTGVPTAVGGVHAIDMPSLDKLHAAGPQAEGQMAQQAAQAQRQAFLYQLKNLPLDQQLAAAAAGQDVDPQIVQAAKDAGFDMASHITLSTDEMEQVRQAYVQSFTLKVQADAAGSRDPATAAQTAKQIADAERNIAEAMPAGQQREDAINKARIDQANATNQAQDVADQITQSKNNLLSSQAHGDPLQAALDNQTAARSDLAKAVNEKLGIAAVNDAQAKLNQADDAVAQQNQAVSAAKIALLKAQHPNDALVQARAAQQDADLAAANAHGIAAQIQAQAQRIAADRAVENAMDAISNSRLQLLQAQAAAAGDDVKAAQYGVDIIQAQLDQAINSKAGEEITNPLRAQLAQQKKAASDANLQNQEDIIQFDLQMKNISIATAIQRYRALLAIADPKETRSLLETIKGLQDQAGQQLGWNLPQNIELPTLYEVNRANQLGGASHYQDNRQIVNQITIDQSMTESQIVNILAQAINTGTSVYGSTPRGY